MCVDLAVAPVEYQLFMSEVENPHDSNKQKNLGEPC